MVSAAILALPLAVLPAVLPGRAETAPSHAPPEAVQRPREIAYFDGTLEAARREAGERNVPLVVFCVLEGEEASDRFRNQLLDNRELALGTASTPVLLVNEGTHRRVEREVPGPDGTRVEREVCSAYRTATCEVHQRNWGAVYKAFVVGPLEGRWALPEVILVLPDGKIHSRIHHANPPTNSEILGALKKARRAAGPGLDREQHARVRGLAAEARRHSQAQAHQASYRSWGQVLAMVSVGPLAEEARAARETALTGLGAEIAAAKAKLDPEHAAEGYRELAALLRVVRGTPLNKNVRNAMAAAEKNPQLRKIVSAVKREMEAESLLAEAQAALAEGQERKGQRLLEKLLAKRFDGTAAAARARELLDEDD